MEFEYDPSEKQKKIWLISSTAIALAGIVFFVVTLTGGNSPFSSRQEQTVQYMYPVNMYANAIGAYSVLSHQIDTLQHFDKLYKKLAEDNNTEGTDSVTAIIKEKERSIKRMIDSIEKSRPFLPDSMMNAFLAAGLNPFKKILLNRGPIDTFQYLANTISNFNPGQLPIPSQLPISDKESLLKDKDEKIAYLETELKMAAMAKKEEKMLPQKTDDGNNADADLSSVPPGNAYETRIAALTLLNSNLNADNQRLMKQQSMATKTGSANETVLKTKVAELQQSVDVLNAEVRLAQVDCNLSRVDAKEIIYTAKQRQILLNEASGILTSLASENNADIRKKVQSKINRLNQVAANSKE